MNVVSSCSYHYVGLMRILFYNKFTGFILRHDQTLLYINKWVTLFEIICGFLNQTYCTLEINIGRDEEHFIVRTVILFFESFRFSENIMSQRMTLEYHIFELIINQFRGRVIITLYLITDDSNFLVYLLLWICAVKYDITQDIDGSWQMLLQ